MNQALEDTSQHLEACEQGGLPEEQLGPLAMHGTGADIEGGSACRSASRPCYYYRPRVTITTGGIGNILLVFSTMMRVMPLEDAGVFSLHAAWSKPAMSCGRSINKDSRREWAWAVAPEQW